MKRAPKGRCSSVVGRRVEQPDTVAWEQGKAGAVKVRGCTADMKNPFFRAIWPPKARRSATSATDVADSLVVDRLGFSQLLPRLRVRRPCRHRSLHAPSRKIGGSRPEVILALLGLVFCALAAAPRVNPR